MSCSNLLSYSSCVCSGRDGIRTRVPVVMNEVALFYGTCLFLEKRGKFWKDIYLQTTFMIFLELNQINRSKPFLRHSFIQIRVIFLESFMHLLYLLSYFSFSREKTGFEPVTQCLFNLEVWFWDDTWFLVINFSFVLVLKQSLKKSKAIS